MDTTSQPPGATPPPPGDAHAASSGPPPGPAPTRPMPTDQPAGDSFFDSLRRSGLVRSEDRWLGGVAGGVALRLGIDPVVVRGLFGLAALFGGVGLVAYGLAWALLPEERDGRIHLQELGRGRFDVGLLGAGAMVAITFFGAGLGTPVGLDVGPLAGEHRGFWSALLWLSAIALVVVLVVASRGTGGGGPVTPLPRGAAPPPPGAAGTWSASAPPPAYTGGPAAPSGPAGAAGPAGPAAGPVPPGPRTDPRFAYGGPPATAYRQPAPPTGAWAPGAVRPAGTYGPYGSRGQYGPYDAAGNLVPPGAPRDPGPPRPVVRRPQGPGSATVGVVVALTLLVLAALMYAERTGEFAGSPLLVATAVGVALAGLGIVVSGLRGRTSGALGGLSIVALLVLLPAVALERAGWDWDRPAGAVGEMSRTPQTVAEAERGYSFGAGEVRVDLTDVPLDEGAVEVPIDVGAGEVTVVVPEGSDVRANVDMFAGDVTWFGDTLDSKGGGPAQTFETADVADGGEPQIELDLRLGAGTVIVEEES